MAAPAVPFRCRKPEGTYAMNVTETIRTFVEFFGDRGHRVVPGSSLVPPDGDPVLFTGGLGISRDRLHATVFGGDEQVGPDLASWQTWTELGVPVERLGADNWWSNGPVGPCGPDSELFAWTGDGPPQGTPGTDGRW